MNETVEFTNLSMVRDGDRVLVIDRKKEDWPGITFPGGHVKAGESFTEAVIREVKEEIGLRVASPQIWKTCFVFYLKKTCLNFSTTKMEKTGSTI